MSIALKIILILLIVSCQRRSIELPQRLEGPTCPQGFVFVKANEELDVHPFCVMKYEARKDPFGKPISMPENLPWTGISLIEAKKRCQGLGRHYDLISNQEWMAMAREIESNLKNWSEGEVFKGYLPRGWSGHAAWTSEWLSNLDPTTAPSTEDCRYNANGSFCAQRIDSKRNDTKTPSSKN